MRPIQKVFNNECPDWEDNANYNFQYLMLNGRHLRGQLLTRGYLLLNEVYETFGFEITRESCVLGWMLSTDGEENIIYCFSNIKGTVDFLIEFDCYPILDRFPSES